MRIRYFAWVKDITKMEYDIIDKNYPRNIEELKFFLVKYHPKLTEHINDNVLRFAINMEYSSINKKLNPNDEIAIFPPVSGG